MYPASSVQAKPRAKPAKPAQKVDEKQSKDIMNSLFDDLDQQAAEDLEQNEVMQQAAYPVAINKEEELAMKYGVTVPEKVEVASNPFSKKRPITEITPSKPEPVIEKPVVKQVIAQLPSEDVEMHEAVEETKQPPVKEEVAN